MQKSSQVVGWLDLVRFKTFKTRKVFTHVDASTGRNPTQQNYVPSISDIKDLKLSNSTGADIREYLIFHISSCHSRAQVSQLLLENPWKRRAKGQRVVAQQHARSTRGKLEPVVHVLCLGLLGKSQFKSRYSETFGDLLQKASRKKIQGKQLLEGGKSTGWTSWPRAAHRSLETLWKLWHWCLMFSAEPWGPSHPVPKYFLCNLGA